MEDDADSREILRSLLGYFGALVTVAEGLREASRPLEALARDAIGKAHILKVLRPEAGAYREVDLAIVPAKPRKN